MVPVTLIAIKPHSYGGKFRKVGDVYNATRSDARVLKALKKATNAGAPTPATYATAAMVAEPVTRTRPDVAPMAPSQPDTVEDIPAVPAVPDVPPVDPFSMIRELPEPRPRRRYRRRDLTSDEGSGD